MKEGQLLRYKKWWNPRPAERMLGGAHMTVFLELHKQLSENEHRKWYWGWRKPDYSLTTTIDSSASEDELRAMHESILIVLHDYARRNETVEHTLVVNGKQMFSDRMTGRLK